MDDTPIFGRRPKPDAETSAAVLERASLKIERLREALKPLAGISLWSDAYPACTVDHICDYNLSRYFTVDEVKAARRARDDEQRERT